MSTAGGRLEVVSEYWVLADKAHQIAEGAPFWAHCSGDPYGLEIDGNEAVLFWHESDSDGYGWYGIERKERRFPAELLLMTDDELAAWKIEQRRLYDEQQAAQLRAKQLAKARQAEEHERAVYAALKRKYG